MISRLFRKKIREAGVSPGALILEGQQKVEVTTIKVISYNEQEVEERTIEDIKEIFPLDNKYAVTWINVRGIHNTGKISNISDYLKLHPLTVEDILNTDQRPKYEDFTDYIYIVLKIVSYNDSQDMIMSEQVSMILGTNLVVTFLELDDPFDIIRKRINTATSQNRKRQADYLVYRLMDVIIDKYFTVLEKISDRIERIEEEVVADPDTKTLQDIHHLKNELILLRKSVLPVRDISISLDREESLLIYDKTHVFLRDISDHIIQIVDGIEYLREIVSGLLDIYLSSVNNRTNAVMKVLTIFATIFIPLTFIASIYGMNFSMPELDISWAYPAVLLVMAIVAIVLLLYFKRKKWF